LKPLPYSLKPKDEKRFLPLTGVPRFLASLYTPEESCKCAVQIGDDHLENMTVDIPCIWGSRFEFLDLAELLDLGD
jgi:hypothetical protein